MKSRTRLLLLLCALLPAELASAQGGPPREGRPVGPLEVHEPPAAAGIAWFGSWDVALAEAKRTGRPILFMSAAPQCKSVPGVW